MFLAVPTTLPRLVAWPGLLVLLATLAASSLIFRLLVRRWTTHKYWLELSRWAEANAMKLCGRNHAVLPETLATAINPPPKAILSLHSDTTTFVEMRTEESQRTDTSQFTHWHVLVRKIEASWPPTGLRPRANRSSVLDLFPLSSFPSMAPPERFVIFGTDSAAARRMAKSSLLALLPADLGLLLHGSTLLLDFTARPLDPMELSRTTALVDQLLAHLPSGE